MCAQLDQSGSCAAVDLKSLSFLSTSRMLCTNNSTLDQLTTPIPHTHPFPAMNGATSGSSQTLPYVDLPYDHQESEKSVRELVYSIQPKWRDAPEQIKIVQFKDGITNTVRLPVEEARAPY